MLKTLVRPWNPRELSILVDIDRQCFSEGIRYEREELQDFAGAPGSTILVVEAGTQIIAYGIVHQRSGRGHLITIDVLPEFRGKGVGSLLLASLHEVARAQGARAIWLEVAVSNLVARRFYEGHGYQRVGMRRRYYPDGSDALIMKRDLTAPTGTLPETGAR